MRHRESHLSMPITTSIITEEDSHSVHKVDVKVPIALSVSLMLSF